jgi:hypothetical protein
MAYFIIDLNKMFEEAQANPKDYLSSEAAQALLEMKDWDKAQTKSIKDKEVAKQEALRKAKEDVKNGIYRGQIAKDGGSLWDHGDGNLLGPLEVFGEMSFGWPGDLDKRPQLREQLKQLAGKQVTIKGTRDRGYTVFDLDKGIEIIPDKP